MLAAALPSLGFHARRAIWICLLPLLLGGCVIGARSPARATHDVVDRLIAHSPYGVAADDDVLAVDPEMRAFVQQRLQRLPLGQRAAALVDAFAPGNALALRYEQDATRSAAGTFTTKRGNCLSFAELYIALAREAGLHVRFREDRQVASWTRLGDLLLLNRHVSVWGNELGGTFDVDFGRITDRQPRIRQIISDRRARAEHFNNLGAEAIARGDVPASIPLFNRALTLEPTLAFVWTNLGAALRMLGRYDDAELALNVAVAQDPDAMSGLSGLERLYRAKGDLARADGIAQSLQRYRERNPYLHFAAAEDALTARDYVTAVQHLRSAVRLNPDEPDFHFELGRAYLAQGYRKLAFDRFRQVKRMIADDDQSHIYATRLTNLLREFAPESFPQAPHS